MQKRFADHVYKNRNLFILSLVAVRHPSNNKLSYQALKIQLNSALSLNLFLTTQIVIIKEKSHHFTELFLAKVFKHLNGTHFGDYLGGKRQNFGLTRYIYLA
jgi:hypothetical protein